MTTDDGLRVAAATASTEKYGNDIFDFIFSLNPDELGQIEGATVPVAAGCSSFRGFQECELVETPVAGRVVSCLYFDALPPASGQVKKPTVVEFHRTPGTYEGEQGGTATTLAPTAEIPVRPPPPPVHKVVIEHPNGLREKTLDLGSTMRQLSEDEDPADSSCPNGPGKCPRCVAKLKFRAATADSQRMAAIAPVSKRHYCTSPAFFVLGCTYPEYKAYLKATHRPQQNDDYLHSLDCDGDGYLGEEELELEGLCFDRMLRAMLQNGKHPDVVRMTASGRLSVPEANVIAGANDPDFAVKIPVKRLLEELRGKAIFSYLMSDADSLNRVKKLVKDCDRSGSGKMGPEGVACVVRRLRPTAANMKDTRVRPPKAQGAEVGADYLGKSGRSIWVSRGGASDIG